MHIRILRRIQRALRFQHRQQILGPGLIAALRNVERGLGLVQFFALPLPLLIQAANAVEGFFDVGKSIDDRASVGFQQFLLAGCGLVALGTETAVIEDRCDQPGGVVL